MVNTIFLFLNMLMLIYWAREWGRTKDKFHFWMTMLMAVGVTCAHLGAL